jgi:hypothetical protein
MKKYFLKRSILPGVLFCIVLGITAMAFQDSGKITTQRQQKIIDTIPKQNEVEININTQDIEKIVQQSLAVAQKSLQEIDLNKISKEVEQSLKSIDVDKIKMKIDNSIKSIDVEKMKKDIDRSMKEIDKAKLKLNIDKEVRNAMKNINTEELKRNLDNMNKRDAEKLKKDMEKLKKDLQRSTSDLKNTTDIIDEMEFKERDYKTDGLFYSI